jgi:putrescine aminotransferase
LPIGGVLVGDAVARVLIEKGGEFHHGFTYSGHPAACAVAIANIEILRREHLVERARSEIGPYLAKRWVELADHPLVGEARIKGMIGALELVKHKKKREFFPDRGKVGVICRDNCVANGLIMRATRDSMLIAPPLVISPSEVDELIEKARRSLDMTLTEVRRQGWM